MGRNLWNQQVLQALSPGPAGQRVQRRALLGTFALAFLLFWWSGWDWWPAVVWFLAPLIVVILPGIRRLVDETWGLIAGFILAALMLMPELPASRVTVAWGLAIAATAGVSLRRHRVGWRKWVPIIALGLGMVLAFVGGLTWWAGEHDRRADAARQAEEVHRYQVSKTLPTSGRSAVLSLVEAVAFTVPQKVDGICFVFTPPAAAQFAAAHQAMDCPGAIAQLHQQVRARGDYANDVFIPGAADRDDPAHRIDACHLDFGNYLTGATQDPGPQIGVLTIERQYGNGYLITGYQPCG